MTAEISSQKGLQASARLEGATAQAKAETEAGTKAWLEARVEVVTEAGPRAVAYPGPALPPRMRSRSLSPHAPLPDGRQSSAKFGGLLEEEQQCAGARSGAGPALPPRSRSPSPRVRPADMLRLLECPVCMEPMFPPIEQCVNGHSVCAQCRLCVSACPECKGAFAGTRCRRLEAVCEALLPRPCRHASLGCRERFFADRLPLHEAACGFRPCRCVLCKQRMPVQELRPHLGLHHRGNVLETATERSVHKDTPKAYSIYLTEAHGHYFWVWKRNGQHEVSMGVGHVVEDDCPPAFEYTLRASSTDGACVLSFSGPVHVAAEHETSLAPCGKCLIVHRDFMKEGAKYSVHITAKEMDKID